MSKKEKDKFEVQPLLLKPKEPVVTRKVRDDHGTPIVSFPRSLLREIGIHLSREVYVEVVKGMNPFTWEIKLRPVLSKEPKKSGSQGES